MASNQYAMLCSDSRDLTVLKVEYSNLSTIQSAIFVPYFFLLKSCFVPASLQYQMVL